MGFLAYGCIHLHACAEKEKAVGVATSEARWPLDASWEDYGRVDAAFDAGRGGPAQSYKAILLHLCRNGACRVALHVER